MTEQQRVSFPAPFAEMTKEEIVAYVAYFNRYDFKDELGHRLELCGDFLDLVDFAKR
jgi:hypothetical protein